MKELNSNSGKFWFSKSITMKFTQTKYREEGCCKFETASNISNILAIFYHRLWNKWWHFYKTKNSFNP